MKEAIDQKFNPSRDTWDIQDEVDSLVSEYSGKLEATINVEPKIRRSNPNPTPTEIRIISMRALKSAERGTGTKFMTELCKIADENNLVMTGHLADKGWSGDPGYDVIDKKKYKTTDSTKRLMNFYKKFGFKRGAKAVSDEGFPFGNIHRMPNAQMTLNQTNNMKEYNVGTSGGYGGGAMAGGPVAPTNWAGTQSGPQTSRRLQTYPASRRYTYMQGNTVIGSSLYDTITDDDLKDPNGKVGPDEILAGLRYEMKRMEYPNKDVAKERVMKNLAKNPTYYSSLNMYFNSDKEGTIMENIDPKELEMGTKIEHEHTKDDALARKIAMDHLAEDPHYYTKLKKAGLEECDYEDDMIAPPSVGNAVAPSIAIVTVGAEGGEQPKLASSGLGSGVPKPLKSTNLEAPENKMVGPNKIATSKTPPISGTAPLANVDPLDHFGCQLAEGWKKDR